MGIKDSKQSNIIYTKTGNLLMSKPIIFREIVYLVYIHLESFKWQVHKDSITISSGEETSILDCKKHAKEALVFQGVSFKRKPRTSKKMLQQVENIINESK